MSIEQALVEKIKELPEDEKHQVLDFAEFLSEKKQDRKPKRSLQGLWADLGVDITEADISEVRREMWRNFPRQDI